MSIQEIVIAGAGTMGYSMTQIFAKYHYSVIIYDLIEEALSNAKKHIQDNVSILLNEQELASQQSQDLLNHLSYTTSKDCFKECDLVAESIIEGLEIKKSSYQDTSQFVKDECILATNTSGISVNELANTIYKPERLIGMY